tara:strand:- start:361 stop:1176 length:816 start_codon:yes stop_codon:yes gene_type:complete
MVRRYAIPADAAADRAGIRITRSEIQHPGERRNISKSAVRALDVLEHFASVRRPLRATDIAHALDMQPSSADQLLKSMTDAGYLLIDAEGKVYSPSPRLLPFANLLVESFFGGEALGGMVASLGASTGQIATLAAPQMASLQIVDVESPPALAGLVRKGSRVSITGTALGAAFLATHDDREVERWIARTPEARHMTDQARFELRDVIAATRQRGFACGLSDQLFSIALALPRLRSGVQLVLGLAGPPDSIDHRVDELHDLMLSHANRLVDH